MRRGGLLATGALHLAALACILMPPAARETGRPTVDTISARILPAPPPAAAQVAAAREARPAPSLVAPQPLLVPAPELVFEAPAAAPVASPAPVAALAIAAVPVGITAPHTGPRTAPPAAAVISEAAFEPARPPDRQCAENGIARHYPRLLRERGIEGRVLLRVKVDEQGRAAEVQVQGGGSGWRLLDEAAKALTQDCRFVPARRGEQTQASWVEYPVRFALQ